MHVCGMQAQLQSLFGLSDEETRTVIQASEYVFEQVLKNTSGPFERTHIIAHRGRGIVQAVTDPAWVRIRL